MARIFLIAFLFLWSALPAQAKTGCGAGGVWLQVLGSGGPELDDGRASTGYVIWRDGKARVLVDLGGGSLDRFEHSGASVNDLDLVLLSHLHVDHSADLPVLVKAAFFSDRDRDLPVYGPTGNRVTPSMTEFVEGLFGANGIYRYLNGFVTGDAAWRLVPHDVDATKRKARVIFSDKRYRVSAVAVHHGPIPALAWRVDTDGKSLVFSGDMNGDYGTLAGLARNADLLVAHHAIPEGATGVARNLHMPPSVIGRVAASARVRQLVLSHRMNRTLGREPESTRWIRRDYQGPMVYADDLQCFRP
jgi:ribonuclease BN (tRNA processing enzyme)